MKQPTEWLEPPQLADRLECTFHCNECGYEWLSDYYMEYFPDGSYLKVPEIDSCPACISIDFE